MEGGKKASCRGPVTFVRHLPYPDAPKVASLSRPFLGDAEAPARTERKKGTKNQDGPGHARDAS